MVPLRAQSRRIGQDLPTQNLGAAVIKSKLIFPIGLNILIKFTFMNPKKTFVTIPKNPSSEVIGKKTKKLSMEL